jgi:hypothetical protein
MDQTHLNFALLGGAVFAGGLIWMGRSQIFWLRARRTPGKVVRVEPRPHAGIAPTSPEAPHYYPTVRFEDDRGALRVFTSREPAAFRYRVGDVVTIVYDRKNPANARLYSPRLLMAQGAAIAAGLAMLIFALAT